MLIPNPTLVTFGELTLDGVAAITIDRAAGREAVEFSDSGPHVTFADIPEQRTHITVSRRLDRPEFQTPVPGDQADLSFIAAAGAHDSARTRIRAMCVVREVRHDVNESSRDRAAAARQTLTLIAISPDGATDPITLEPL